MKRLLVILVGLVIILVAAVLVAPSFIDWNQYKGEIAGPIEEATGRRLAMNGDLSLAVLPSPRVSAADVRLSGPSGGDDFVRLRSLEVQVAFWPLLRGEIQVVSVRLVEPEVFLEVAADGTPNWGFEAADAVSTEADEEGGASTTISVERVVIANGAISYSDAATGDTRRVESITATLTADSLAKGPFAAEGRFVVNGQPVGFDVSLGQIEADRNVPLRGRIELERGDALASIQGSVSRLTDAPALDAKLTFEGRDLREALSVLAGAAGIEPPLVVPGAQSFALSADLMGSAQQAALNNLSIQIGDTRATGAIAAALEDQVQLDVTLALGRVDLDAWSNAVSVEAGAGRAAADRGVNESESNPLDALIGLRANLNLTAEALTYRGSLVRQARLVASVAEGALDLTGLSAMLPGGSDISLSGRVATVDGQPRFDGSVEAASSDFRALTEWLGVPLDGVAPDRLRQVSLQSRVRATRELGQVYGIDLRLDSSRITGGAAYAFRARPSFSVDLEIDRLNIDAYLAGDGESTSSDEGTGAATVSPETGALAVLDSFDTNAKFSIGSLTYGGSQFGGVRLDATLLAGELTLREAAIDNAGGASLVISGSVASFANVPAFDTRIAVKAADAAAPARFFGIDLPVDARALGAVDIGGTLIGSAEDLAVDVVANVAGMRAGIAGRVELIAAVPRFDLKGSLSGPSYLRALQLAGLSLASQEADGPMSITGAARGGLDTVNLDANVKAADLALVLGGAVTEPMGAPQYNISLQVNHPDLEGLVRMAGADYRPAAVNLGAVRALADVAGADGRVTVSRLEGALGPVNFVGDATVGLRGPRPRIDARLSTSEILVDLFLPREAGGANAGGGGASASATASGGERWSQEQIDLSALRGFDANLELRARGLTYGDYALREPVLVAVLEDGALTVDPLAASLFSGTAAIRMTAVAERRARIGLSLKLDGANIEDALRTSAGLDRVTGLFGMEGEVTTTGQSQFELVRNLNGALTFQARDGVVRGVDLPSLSGRLGELNRGLDFADLLVRTLEGGETKYRSLTGSFKIENGVARSNDLRADLDAAEGDGTAVVDLPRWRLDMSTRARLTDHPESPDVGLDLNGPIDNPQRNLRTRDLEQYITQRIGTTLIRKLLDDDDGAAPSTAPAATQQQNQDGRIPVLPGQEQVGGEAQQPSSTDVLRGLIRRLGDR